MSKHAFSGTNGEDAVEDIENLLEVPNVTHDQLRLSVFPVSLTRTASNWLKDEPHGLITTWVDLTFFLENSIRLLLLKRGDDEEVLTNDELSNPGDESLIEENEIAEIFRIELTYSNLRHLYAKHSRSMMNTKMHRSMSGIKTFHGLLVDHGMIRIGNMVYFEDYGWYEELEDGELKEEALREKSMFEGSRAPCSPIDEWEDYEHTTYIESHVFYDIDPKRNGGGDGGEIVEGTNNDNVIQDEKEPKNEDDVIGNLDDYLVRKDAPYYVNEDEERYKERGCKLLRIPYTKPLTHKTERFEIIK
ncbi:hypothetical protein Tco_0521887 [Tanacetum coccineum]